MGSYNVRRYVYPNSEQLRLYFKPIVKNVDSKKKENEENWKDSKFDFDGSVENYYRQVKKPSKYVPYADDEEVEIIDCPAPKKSERSLKVSSNRTKQKVYEIVRANTWDWFLTFTFDREKVDSSNYDETLKKIRKWFNHQKNRYAPDLKYIIIPELHKDGIHYHFHGLLADCGDMKFVDSGHFISGKKIYNLESFGMGFTTASRVEDTEKVSSYIVKYITKDLNNSLFNKHRYLASRNLNKPKIEELNLTVEEKNKMLCDIGEKVQYQKTQNVGVQEITYLELKKD